MLKYDPSKESEIAEYWESIRLHEKQEKKHESDEKFYFVDGPPYANALPHMGHALTRVLREVFLKYHQMKGRNVWLQLGFDTHGLPVSVLVQRKLGLKTNQEIEEFGVEKFNEECRKHALEYLGKWTEFYKQLGSTSLWDLNNRYFTFDDEYIDSVLLFFKKAHENGLLYKGSMTVPWCPSCETALSAHEASEKYKDVQDDSIFVKFKAMDDDYYFLVWTTTPWTLPANVALAVRKDYDYVKVKVGEEYWVIAKELLEKVLEKTGKSDYEVVEEFKGEKLVGVKYRHLLEDKIPLHKEFDHVVIDADFVTLEEGTGIVHIAPGHGPEDYDAGLKNNLKVLCPVDERGVLTDEAGAYSGLFVFDANKVIIEDLEKTERLVFVEKITHRYAHCPRCESRLIYKSSPQWFVKIQPLKEKMLEENAKVKWVPAWVGSKRFKDWLENARDWCISRQKYWGIPLPIWECPECGSFEVLGSKKEILERAVKGADQLKELHKPWVDNIVIKCSKCDSEMKRVLDIADVWLDSGAATWAPLHYPRSKEVEKWYPMDFVTEGLDQTRGWFYSLMVENIVVFGSSPYKSVLVNGLVLDKTGEKMSKSKGNVTDPVEVINKHGADALRWYLLLESAPWENRKFDEDRLKLVKNNLNILYNVYNFAEKLLQQTSVEKPEVLMPEDKWLLSRLQSFKKTTNKAYGEDLNPTIAARALEGFIVNDLSRAYIKFVRNRVKEGENTQAVAWVLVKALAETVVVASPILPFTSERIFQELRKHSNMNTESVHLLDWPEPDESFIDEELEEKMDKAMQAIELCSNIRNRVGINLRQPLPELVIITDKPFEDLDKIVREQDNVKKVLFSEEEPEGLEKAEAQGVKVFLDTTITPELKKEGLTREFVRRVQQMRKELRLVEADRIKLNISPKPDIDYYKLLKTTNAELVEEKQEQLSKKWAIDGNEYEISISKE